MDTSPTPRPLVEIAFFTDKLAAMRDFYAALLGVAPQAESAEMAIFVTQGVRLFLHRSYQPGPGELPPENHIAFAATDVDAALAALAAAGVEPETPAQNYYWGRSAYLRDPDGHLVELNAPEA